MMIRGRKISVSLAIEYGFVLLIIAALCNTAWFLYENHYLPQPWFYEPSGTFMDWFSLTRWAHIRGAYDIEGSIYPPLSFVVMRMFSFPHCYRLTYSEEVRPCDWIGIVALSMFLLISIILSFLTFLKLDRRTGFPRAFALSLGFPMLYGFERGNFIILCYTCTLLAYGPLVRSARLRWLFAGLAVNFKVYMITIVVAPLLRRRWLATEGMLIATIGVYLVTWMILGEGAPLEILRNISDYSAAFGANTLLDLWFPSSYTPVRTLLTSSFPLHSILDSDQIEVTLICLQIFVGFGQALILIASAATWFRPEVVPMHRIAFLALSLALCSTEASGYTECILVFFVFMERWRGFLRPSAIVIGYILCIPWDYVLGYAPPLVRSSYLANSDVIAQYGIGLFSLLRPGLSLIMTMLLACLTITDVWNDIRKHGWAGRSRYYRDWMPLPRALRPTKRAAEATIIHPSRLP